MAVVCLSCSSPALCFSIRPSSAVVALFDLRSESHKHFSVFNECRHAALTNLFVVTHLRTKSYFLIILSLELKLLDIQLVSLGLLWLQSQKMQLNRQRRGAACWCVDSEQFNSESVYDDGWRDENAENHHSSRLEPSGGGA